MFFLMVALVPRAAFSWLKLPFPSSQPQVLPQLQEFYRYAWTRPHMRDVMRNGMHLMLPDDHDIFNALE